MRRWRRNLNENLSGQEDEAARTLPWTAINEAGNRVETLCWIERIVGLQGLRSIAQSSINVP
jgi:hypothetical protein